MAKNPLTMLIRQKVLSFLLAIRCIARIVCDIRTVRHCSWTDKQFKLFVAVPGTMVIAIVALIEIELAHRIRSFISHTFTALDCQWHVQWYFH